MSQPSDGDKHGGVKQSSATSAPKDKEEEEEEHEDKKQHVLTFTGIRRRSSTETFAKETGEFEFVCFATLQEASDYTKIPIETLLKYIEFSEENSCFISIRDRKTLLDIGKRRDDTIELFFNKPGPIKTKMNSDFPRGHIPRDPTLCTEEFQVLDNAFSGNFPPNTEESVDLPYVKALKKTLTTHDSPHITEVRMYGNRVCFREDVIQYAKTESGYLPRIGADEKEIRAPKHYIQEVESLHSILKNIARAVYSEASISGNELLFRCKDKQFVIKISDIEPPITQELLNALLTEAKKTEPLVTKAKPNLKAVSEVLNAMDNQLFEIFTGIDAAVCPIWEKTIKAGQAVELPLMVMAGNNGKEIGSDLDILQLPAPFGLPTSMHELRITSKTPGAIIPLFNQAISDMETLIANTNNMEMKPKYEALLKEVIATRDYYDKMTPSQRLSQISVLGTTNVYGITKQHQFNTKHFQDDNTPWPHGADDLHPASKPENFGVVLVVNKDHLALTGSEDIYLRYLLHDRRILTSLDSELALHPFWLNKDDPCVEYWKDIVHIQALVAKKAFGTTDQYFANLLVKINLDSREPNIRAEAIGVIQQITEMVSKIDIQSIDTEIEKIYNRHKADVVAIQEAITSTKRTASVDLGV